MAKNLAEQIQKSESFQKHEQYKHALKKKRTSREMGTLHRGVTRVKEKVAGYIYSSITCIHGITSLNT